jgi:hypothetical protein
VLAQAPSDKPNYTEVTLPGEIKWSPAPATLPAGAQLAIIEGDPSKPGEFTMRLRMPAGYRIPPHFHAAAENVTVIQGTFHVGMGEKFDTRSGHRMPVGAFVSLPAGMRHFTWTEGEAIVQVHGMGPWNIEYVNPADDPSRKSKLP